MFTSLLSTIAKIVANTYRDVTDIYIMEYNSATKQNEILVSATTCMDIEGIILSEISQRKTNTVWFHLYVGI